MTGSARHFAHSGNNNMITIWVSLLRLTLIHPPLTCFQDMWRDGLYNDDTVDADNPLRDIMVDPDIRREYFKEMSRAMAAMCSVFATVMTQDITKIPESGIWGQVEKPQLMANKDELLVWEVFCLPPPNLIPTLAVGTYLVIADSFRSSSRMEIATPMTSL
jgi:hypothetical protein